MAELLPMLTPEILASGPSDDATEISKAHAQPGYGDEAHAPPLEHPGPWREPKQKLIDDAFAGVTKPTSLYLHAVLVVGPPGSGKSRHGWDGFKETIPEEKRDTFVTVSLDGLKTAPKNSAARKGVLGSLPGYSAQLSGIKAMWDTIAAEDCDRTRREQAELFHERRELRKEACGQAGDEVRDGIVSRALAEGYNPLVVMNPAETLNLDVPVRRNASTQELETKNVTVDAEGMAELLKSMKMHVDVIEYLAPADVTMERVIKGDTLMQQEVLSSRLKSYQALLKLINTADSVSVHISESKDAPPLQTLTWKRKERRTGDAPDGPVSAELVKGDDAAQRAFLQVVEADKLYFQHHKNTLPHAVEELTRIETAIIGTFSKRAEQTPFNKLLDEISSSAPRRALSHSGPRWRLDGSSRPRTADAAEGSTLSDSQVNRLLDKKQPGPSDPAEEIQR